MMVLVRLFLSFLTAYFYGRAIYCYFTSSKYKHSLISKLHSFFIGLAFTSITFWYYTVITKGNNSNFHVVEICFIVIIYFFKSLRNRKIMLLQRPLNSSLDISTIKETVSSEKKLERSIANNKPLSTEVDVSSNKVLYNKKKSILDYIAQIIIFLIVLLFFFRCLRFPDGAWDAFAIWNLKAKFLACGNESWLEMFSDYYDYIHCDYPLFLPCVVARLFNYAHGTVTIIPLILSCFFSINCFILTYLYLKQFKNHYYAIFALCVLVFSPNILNESSNQYSDIPLAVYFLISLYEIIIWDIKSKKLPWICIIISSLSFWIKNEGAPWFIIYCLLILFYMYKKEGKQKNYFKKYMKVITVSFPVLITILSVKYLANFTNDLVLGFSERLKQILILERYKEIIAYYFSFIKTHFWIAIIPTILISKFIDNRYCKYKYLLYLILFMYICYFFIYLITPHNLEWHLECSFSRISTVYLPSLMFLGCLLFDFKKNK